uniref:Secreted protein n=1 Tax=Haemonchus contortus TaxID=6289 RepID=A0A7I4YT64_HAECO|nr:unnamed protein product [Haemonchus contortus]
MLSRWVLTFLIVSLASLISALSRQQQLDLARLLHPRLKKWAATPEQMGLWNDWDDGQELEKKSDRYNPLLSTPERERFIRHLYRLY